MKSVWMCKPEDPAVSPEQVPMDQNEIAKRHWDGWRQCEPPEGQKPAEDRKPEPTAEGVPEAPETKAPDDHREPNQ
jgi:hypothetical protein